MPTKIVVDLQTNEIIEVELEGEELAAYQAALEAQAAETIIEAPVPEPSLADLVAQLQLEIENLKKNQTNL